SNRTILLRISNLLICQQNHPSATSGNGRTPSPVSPPDSPPSPSCIPSMLSNLGFKVHSNINLNQFLFSVFPYIVFNFLSDALSDFAVNDGRVSHLPNFKNTTHTIFTITRSQ
ncbi:hypothetical protein RYX36_007930, partial [Vicia faba]